MTDSLVDLVGNTPLLRLRRASEETGCTILGKCEFLNPGGSIKDRAALAIIEDAEARELLRPGGTIVEGTAGNTGIGLTVVGSAKGYRTVIVIPVTQSPEKKDMLRLAGAELIEVPAVPYKDPNNYVKVSGRIAAERAQTDPNGAIWANQFDNVANRDGHARHLGPGHTIVTVLCDHGSRYTSRLFNPVFLREKGLPTPAWLVWPEGCSGGSSLTEALLAERRAECGSEDVE